MTAEPDVDASDPTEPAEVVVTVALAELSAGVEAVALALAELLPEVEVSEALDVPTAEESLVLPTLDDELLDVAVAEDAAEEACDVGTTELDPIVELGDVGVVVAEADEAVVGLVGGREEEALASAILVMYNV